MLSIILYNDEIEISHYYSTFIYPIVKTKNKIFVEIIENIIMYYYKIIEFELYKNINTILLKNNEISKLLKKIIQILTLEKIIIILKKIIFYKNNIYYDENTKYFINIDLIINENDIKLLYKNNIKIMNIYNNFYNFIIICCNMYDNKYKLFNDVIQYECKHYLNYKLNINWLEYDYSMINYKIFNYINIIKNKCEKKDIEKNIKKYKHYAIINYKFKDNNEEKIFKDTINNNILKNKSYQNLKSFNDNNIKLSKSSNNINNNY